MRFVLLHLEPQINATTCAQELIEEENEEVRNLKQYFRIATCLTIMSKNIMNNNIWGLKPDMCLLINDKQFHKLSKRFIISFNHLIISGDHFFGC